MTRSHPRLRVHSGDIPSRCATLLSLLVLLGCFAWPAHGVDVVKSPSDDRLYRYLQLPNQLQVLLISDPDTEKAAAAMDVFAGSANDPPGREGLAHFLEHMLFLGTEEYPQADDYQSYISAHGGTHNAYTAPEHTNYFFDINADYLESGLDRFAQFFIAPLFNADYVERERNAVHSEYRARLQDEYLRTLDVYRQVMNPDHPLAKFSIGNLTTLSEDKAAEGGESAEDSSLRQDLLDFYQQHYNASAMALVVLGRESLDDLEAMVRRKFSAVPNRHSEAESLAGEDLDVGGDLDESESEAGAMVDQSAADNSVVDNSGADNEEPGKPVISEPLFSPGDLPMQIAIQPVTELRRLSLLFPIPPTERLYRRKPVEYLGNLLGHEGEGSLLSVLKARGWAKALSAGVSLATETSALFEITIDLTENGLSQRESVVGLVFATIEEIAREGIGEWRFQELQRLGEIAFRFQEKASSLTTVQSLAHNLHYYPPAEVIAGDYRWQAYDPALIKHFASYLNPGNVVVVTTAPDVPTERVTHYFSTPYSVDRSSLELARLDPELRAQLQLPQANPFIPQNLSLKSRPNAGEAESAASEPNLLKDASRIRVWFKQDRKFRVPRASTFLRIKSPQAAQSLEGAALVHLYVAMIRDALNEYAYPARLAGLHYSLQANSRGLDVVVSGYNDGQDQLFERIVEQMSTPRFSRQRFATVKNELLRQWRNASLDPPHEQLVAALPTLLFSPWWPISERVEALDALDFEDLEQFSKRVFVDSRAELLLYGNMTRAEAAKLAGLVEVDFLRAMADKTLPAAEVVQLRPSSAWADIPIFAKSVQHADKATVLYLQGSGDSLEERASMLLLQQIIRAPFFHQLRTEQQLGYVVFVAAMPFKDVPGTVLIVQSPLASLEALMNATQLFVAQAAELVPQDPAQHKNAVLNELLEVPQNLHEQAARYWESITEYDAAFDYREQLAQAIMGLGTDELSAYLERTLVEQPRALWVVASAEPIDVELGELGLGELGEKGEDAEQPDNGDASQADDASQGDNDAAPWTWISEWAQFKAERDSYVYP